MSRYTGSSYKQARRTNFSLLENGKDLHVVLMDQVNMEMIVKKDNLHMVNN